MILIVDASTTLEWFLPGQFSLTAAASLKVARRSLVVVPAIWVFETQNVLLKCIRQRKLTSADAQDIRTELSLISTRVMEVPDQETIRGVWEIATHQTMTFYDAAYVELAWRLNLPLASSDTAIRAAATVLGIKLL